MLHQDPVTRAITVHPAKICPTQQATNALKDIIVLPGKAGLWSVLLETLPTRLANQNAPSVKKAGEWLI